jgi:hypothetical protein
MSAGHGDLHYFRLAILADWDWPEANRAFQTGLAALFSQQPKAPFDYCHPFVAEALGYSGSDEALSRRVSRHLLEHGRAQKLVGRKTFDYRPGGGSLKRVTQYRTNYLNLAAAQLLQLVENDREALPLAVKVQNHLPKVRKLLPLLTVTPRKKGKQSHPRVKKGGGASNLKDVSVPLNSLGLMAEKCAAEKLFVTPLYSVIDGACNCRLGSDCERPGKHPRLTRFLQSATRNPLTIRSWWGRRDKWPNAGIGIATGREKAGDDGLYLVVLDIDRRRFGHGILQLLLEELGEELPETKTVVSADGWHYYFWIRANSSPSSFSHGGLEVKGSGGVAVHPPTVHYSGHVYHLEGDAEIATLSGGVADWILSRGRRETVQISERHKFLVRCARKLASQHYTTDEIHGTLAIRLNECCERGGREITDDELAGIAKWAYQKESAQGAQAAKEVAA